MTHLPFLATARAHLPAPATAAASLGTLCLCVAAGLSSSDCCRADERPPVHFLVPGFTAHRLPVDLPNVNELAYRSDGALVAVGYDGRIHVLRDRDGDGLEDQVKTLSDAPRTAPLGLVIEPDRYLLVARGQVIALYDRDGDDVIDEERVLADGWPPPAPVTGGGVDALGLATAEDGSIYFGLGTEDYSNAYLVRDGQSHFRLDSVRGTVQRIDPLTGRRETVCTGVRFPVSMAFNHHGDLFCTDQEGATWLPDGNPLDELLHLQPGRHYGFPPFHPQYLPDVIDEPSVFDFAPQHQSTCGLIFNDGVHGGPAFGPAHWNGDALVAGYSRGKLYRVKLIKSEHGYIAQGSLWACLDQLTLDLCLSPQGDLVVAMHSGGPDWGSGPAGPGYLWKIRYTDRQTPQPLNAWCAGPRELRVAFDRPVPLDALRGVAGRFQLETGDAVAPGDALERLRPGYQVVQDQGNAPRNRSTVDSLALAGDQRTLILATVPLTSPAPMALSMPAMVDGSMRRDATPPIELGLAPHGVAIDWQPAAPTTSETAQQTWLPTIDWAVSSALLNGSAEFDRLRAATELPGQLTITTQLDLWQFLHPAIQPGAALDYQRSPEQVTIQLRMPKGSMPVVEQPAKDGLTERLPIEWLGEERCQFACIPTADAPLRLAVSIPTPFSSDADPLAGAAPEPPATTLNGIAELNGMRGVVRGPISIGGSTDRDRRLRPLPLRRFRLPWVRSDGDRSALEATARRGVAELAGANWVRGREEFYAAEANCGACHRVRGEGGTIGPDLSNLIARDYSSVLRDIREPSYAINPDFAAHRLLTHDGRILIGRLLADAPADRLRFADQRGQVTELSRDEVEQLEPAATSLMPEGIVAALGPARLRDLLAFVLLPPPMRMPDYGSLEPPPPRSREEVERLLAGSEPQPTEAELPPIHIVLVAGPKDHGPGEHDYPAWQTAWHAWLSRGPKVVVEKAWEWPSEAQLASADVLVFYKRGQWNPQQLAQLDAFYARDRGIVVIHWGVEGSPDYEQTALRLGLVSHAGKIKYRHGPLDLDFSPGAGEPIARNLATIALHDESYWEMLGDANRVRVLATTVEEGKTWPMIWTYRPPAGGRAFVSIPGHYAWSFDDPIFQTILLRGISWAAGQSVDRLNPLVESYEPPTP